MPRRLFNEAAWSGNAGATDIRGWGKAVSDSMLAMGFVKTADSGQIDWATVVSGGSGAITGYEVWRFNDAVQATAPLVFRLDYGQASGRPLFYVEVGKGSNGSGTITDTIGSRLTANLLQGSSSTTGTSYVSSDGSSLALMLWAAESSSGPKYHLIIERSRDSSGAPTGAGVVVAFGYSSTVSTWNVYNYASPSSYTRWQAGGPAKPPVTVSGSPLNQNSSVAADANNAPAVPVALYASGVPAWVMQTILMILPGDAGLGGEATVTINGTPHQYRAMPNSIPLDQGGVFYTNSGSSYLAPCIWWED